MYPSRSGIRQPGLLTLLLLVPCGTGCYAWHTEGVAPAPLLEARQRHSCVSPVPMAHTLLSQTQCCEAIHCSAWGPSRGHQ